MDGHNSAGAGRVLRDCIATSASAKGLPDGLDAAILADVDFLFPDCGGTLFCGGGARCFWRACTPIDTREPRDDRHLEQGCAVPSGACRCVGGAQFVENTQSNCVVAAVCRHYPF